MSSPVRRNSHIISSDTRLLISARYKRITRAINSEFWNSSSETDHSLYVGSYGRNTAINTSDLDVMVILPEDEYDHFTSLNGNGPSKLLQAVKNAISNTYPNTSIHGDGQVVVIKFSDGMRFEILPAFQHMVGYGYYRHWDGTYIYPDSNMGGKVMYTYTAHHKIADRAKKRKAILDCVEIVITSVSAVGLLSGIITNVTAIKLIGGFSSAVSLAITLYTKNDTLQTIIREHVDAANDLWLVREKYQSLIIDFDGMETSQIQDIREEIMHEVDQINRKYPGTDPYSFKAAQKALKVDEEQYFAPGEADLLLPHTQKRDAK